MKSTQRVRWELFAAMFVIGLMAGPARAIVVVYDLRLDFSDTNNPNGAWAYHKGTNLLSHFSPVPQPTLAAAVANGYWGDTSSSLNSSIMKTTANGSSTGLWSNNDFLAGDVLVRTTDPSTGGAVIVTWTAPSSGTFTYSGDIWFAGAPTGPGSNDFTLTLNAGPALEAGTAGLGQDETNPVVMVNGLTPTSVNPGDVLALQLSPSIGMPFGSLAGAGLVVDFVPAPEPSSLLLGLSGIIGSIAWWMRRSMWSRRAAEL